MITDNVLVKWGSRSVALLACCAWGIGFLGCVAFAEPSSAESTAAESAEQASTEEIPSPSSTPRVSLGLYDPRGEPELIVCTQNLKVFGSYQLLKTRSSGYSKVDHAAKMRGLIKRFAKAKCDVIAVQEILGASELEGKAALEELANEARRVLGRVFEVVVGISRDKNFRNGFLVAKDRASVLAVTSYDQVALPKMFDKQRARFFIRPPLELQLQVRGRGDASGKRVVLVNIHFKSRAGSSKDPTGLEWETYRMEMAEGVRRVMERRHREGFSLGEPLLVVLGDRNANFDRASAKILEGSILLENFRRQGACRMLGDGVPVCKGALVRSGQSLFSVLWRDKDARQRPGTYSYKGEFSWLDDILLPAPSLPFAQELTTSEGDYASDVIYEPKDASDHALAYVHLNW